MRTCGVILWVAGLLAVAVIAARVDPSAYGGGRSRDERERIRRNSSALATMLGEFRTSMSDIMFIKTERYLHGGVGYVEHHADPVLSSGELADEVDEHQRKVGSGDAGDPQEHSGMPTLIPGAEHDFRGIIGRLHREVKPWRDPAKPHLHTDGRELLPWFRLMTASDPHYVRGYVAGGFWLQLEGTEKALLFVDEGIRKNPDAFQLYVSRGLLRIKAAREFGNVTGAAPAGEVREALVSALEDFQRAVDLAGRQRPAGASDADLERGGEWGRYQEDDMLAACTMTVTLTRRLGDPAAAVILARRYLEWFPQSEPLRAAAGYEPF